MSSSEMVGNEIKGYDVVFLSSNFWAQPRQASFPRNFNCCYTNLRHHHRGLQFDGEGGFLLHNTI